MSVARSLCISLRGLDGFAVEVEAEVRSGLPAFVIVGLPDSSMLQARERVRSACVNVGHAITDKRVTVNLTPAWIPKQGTAFDLAIAMSALASAGVIEPDKLAHTVFLGELTLDGEVRPVPGVLPALRAAVSDGVRKAVVARANRLEAHLVPGIQITDVAHLAEAIRLFGGQATRESSFASFVSDKQRDQQQSASEAAAPSPDTHLDFADVVGQERFVYAAQVAAAGGHHMLMIGPPGAGKTMVASRLPTILPPLEDSTALELSAIASVAGSFDAGGGLVRTPPFVAPHHSSSAPAIIGGGTSIAAPGAISRAHGGILFLDEAPEFAPRVLEALREPLESGDITIHRSKAVTTYPARFQLVIAANPCPCGRAYGSGAQCTCTAQQKRRYQSKLSGPIVDRVDVRVRVSQVSAAAVHTGGGIASAELRERVCHARARQRERLEGSGFHLNAHVRGSAMNTLLPLTRHDDALLIRALERGQLTMRGRDRVRRLAWSIADLEGRTCPSSADVAKALELRGHDIL